LEVSYEVMLAISVEGLAVTEDRDEEDRQSDIL
jgi:hypothetical protein